MRKAPDTIPWVTKAAHFATNLVARGVILAALTMPSKMRGRVMGWMMAHVIGPLAGYRKRARAHVAMILPHLPSAEQKRIADTSLYNAGRTVIENYATRDLLDQQKNAAISGAGFAALSEARAKGRPALLVSGHFGNYEAVRAALIGRGFDVGGLYRDMSNPYFNAHYVQTLQALGGPVFAQDRAGMAGFLRHLKSGGQLVLLFDQHVENAPILDFLGKPAHTSTSAAELALRYDASLIPFYGIRQPDGLSFASVLEAPIPHSDPVTMTQALNDSLRARILENPEQWFWVARRWRANRIT
ncbi:lysophospholipid acyltransferase family protein [Tateyamaria pelophila]|uniref:lysophospholipid acyltransferase family protein n=1 Tax=Tateyamaria pelophila TaxID=328415 RepID=UPI001CBF5736|nr:lysophospholipid acyltransferase family protein [Tateyamaria pelophila]